MGEAFGAGGGRGLPRANNTPVGDHRRDEVSLTVKIKALMTKNTENERTSFGQFWGGAGGETARTRQDVTRGLDPFRNGNEKK